MGYGQKLAELRERAGYKNYREMAAALAARGWDVPYHTYRRIEREEVDEVKGYYMVAIGDTLHLSLSETADVFNLRRNVEEPKRTPEQAQLVNRLKMYFDAHNEEQNRFVVNMVGKVIDSLD